MCASVPENSTFDPQLLIIALKSNTEVILSQKEEITSLRREIGLLKTHYNTIAKEEARKAIETIAAANQRELDDLKRRIKPLEDENNRLNKVAALTSGISIISILTRIFI